MVNPPSQASQASHSEPQKGQVREFNTHMYTQDSHNDQEITISNESTQLWATLGTGVKVELATTKARLGARILDLLVMIIISTVISCISFLVIVNFVNPDIANSDISLNSDIVRLAIPVFVLTISMVVLYEITLIAVKGQTLGKIVTKVKVVRADNGDPPDWIHSILRFATPAILSIVPIIGLILGFLPYLASLRSDYRQGWHDKVAKTLVVKA